MPFDTIDLNFINLSNDQNNSSILIFQQNAVNPFDDNAVAWKVIQNCGRLENHPFKFPLQFQVCAKDSWGNYSPLLTAKDGQAFEMVQENSGEILKLSTTAAASQDEVEVRNNLPMGSISACVFKDGKLLAMSPFMAPGQKYIFQFLPKIYIAAVSQIEQGQIINPSKLGFVLTELDLFGIVSTDIVMTGGGDGPDSLPLTFNLQNTVS